MIRTLPLASMLAALAVAAGIADRTAVAQESDAVTRLTVHPADAPDPALKYRLLPPLSDRRPGNAAVWYGKVTAEQSNLFNSSEIWEQIGAWATMPLDEVRTNELLQSVTDDSGVFKHLEAAARSESCDWQLPIRDEPFYEILLPEVQQARQFARLLAVRVRRQLAEGDFEGAIRSLQSGYALARNLAEGPTLVNALVGFAASHLMSRQLQDYVQQPEAPNLYWALTVLPDPLVDARPGIDAELAAFELTFPDLRDLHSTDYDQQYWKQQLETLWKSLDAYRYGDLSSQVPSLFWLTVRGYPAAKKGLIDAGWSQERVEAMPVAQVVLVYSVAQYQRRRDEQMKWLYVPYPATRSSTVNEGDRIASDVGAAEEILPLFETLIPATRAFRYSAANAQRQIAVLRLVEAIRLYGARHNGELPPSLEAIAEVPVPLDPVNGKPFGYRVEGNTAVIEGAPLRWNRPDLPPQRWELQFAQTSSP